MNAANNSFEDTIDPPVWMILNYVLTGVGLLLVLLRCFVRFRIVKGWGWDDSFMIIASVFLIAICVAQQMLVNTGAGRHIWTLSQDKIAENIKWLLANDVVFILCPLFTRISISFFILRITGSEKMKWLLSFLMAAMTIATIQGVVMIMTLCTPTRKLWTPSLEGSCRPFWQLFLSSYIQSGFAIVYDLVLTLSPIFLLWRVEISLRRKFLVCALMSLGLVATIAVGLRNMFVEEHASKDFTYDTSNLVVCTVLENTLGIIAACIPACWPIVHWLRGNTGLQSKDQDSIVKTTEITLEEIERTQCRTPASSFCGIDWSPPSSWRGSTITDLESLCSDRTVTEPLNIYVTDQGYRPRDQYFMW